MIRRRRNAKIKMDNILNIIAAMLDPSTYNELKREKHKN